MNKNIQKEQEVQTNIKFISNDVRRKLDGLKTFFGIKADTKLVLRLIESAILSNGGLKLIEEINRQEEERKEERKENFGKGRKAK